METCVKDPSRECIGAAKAALLERRIEDLKEWRQDSNRWPFYVDYGSTSYQYSSIGCRLQERPPKT